MQSLENLLKDFQYDESIKQESTQMIRIENNTIYDCKLCNNKRYFEIINDNGDLCYKECECKKKLENIKKIKNSGLDKLLDYSFEKYDTSNDYQESIKNLALDYLNTGYHYGYSFGMFGQSGVGKSMICGIICNELLKRNKNVLYITYDDLRTKFVEGKVSNDFYTDDNKYIRNVEVLYIDDLFKGLNNTFHVDIIFHLINYRYNKGLITIFSSELLLKEIANLNVALCGRIVEMCNNYYVEIEKDASKNYRRNFAKGLKIENDSTRV